MTSRALDAYDIAFGPSPSVHSAENFFGSALAGDLAGQGSLCLVNRDKIGKSDTER